MNPYYQDEAVTIYHGDCRDILPSLGKVDAVVTDPPYSSGGMYRSDRAVATNNKYQISHETTRTYGAFSGDNRDQRSFEKWVDGWASQCLRLVPEGGGLAVFIDWRNVASIVDAIQIAGWVYRGLTPWHKGTDLRPNKGWFRRNVEFVVWGSAGPLACGPRTDGDCYDGLFVARGGLRAIPVLLRSCSWHRRLLGKTQTGSLDWMLMKVALGLVSSIRQLVPHSTSLLRRA